MNIFKAADKDNSGTLTVKEFQDVIDDIIIRYPQVELYLKNKHLNDVKDLLKDPKGNERKEIDIEGFKSALCQVDSQMKSLPATAQVFIFHALGNLELKQVYSFALSRIILQCLYVIFWHSRLLLNKVHTLLIALTVGSNAKRIQKGLYDLEILAAIIFAPFSMSNFHCSSYFYPYT